MLFDFPWIKITSQSDGSSIIGRQLLLPFVLLNTHFFWVCIRQPQKEIMIWKIWDKACAYSALVYFFEKWAKCPTIFCAISDNLLSYGVMRFHIATHMSSWVKTIFCLNQKGFSVLFGFVVCWCFILLCLFVSYPCCWKHWQQCSVLANILNINIFRR